MAPSLTTIVKTSSTEDALPITRRELAVLAVAVAVVVGAILLLVLTSHQVASLLSGPG